MNYSLPKVRLTSPQYYMITSLPAPSRINRLNPIINPNRLCVPALRPCRLSRCHISCVLLLIVLLALLLVLLAHLLVLPAHRLGFFGRTRCGCLLVLPGSVFEFIFKPIFDHLAL
jgi:hypothetical protein